MIFFSKLSVTVILNILHGESALHICIFFFIVMIFFYRNKIFSI